MKPNANDTPTPPGYDLLPGEELITIADASKLLRGHRGKGAGIDVIRRWMNPLRGALPLGPDGPRVVLKAVKVGGRLWTTARWCDDFDRQRMKLGWQAMQRGTPERKGA